MSLFSDETGIVLSVVLWFFLPDFPQTAKFLSAEERIVASHRLGKAAPSMNDAHLDWKILKRTVMKLDFWIFSVVLFLLIHSLMAAGYFLPTLIADVSTDQVEGRKLADLRLDCTAWLHWIPRTTHDGPAKRVLLRRRHGQRLLV